MAVFKCKMCGGELNINPGDTVVTCEYCGTTQTIPYLDSDKKARLFNRANEYRLNNEFDKAYSSYETIINEEPEEAEAYWGLILSEYGVEYVEDPTSHKRVPTCHRTKVNSITSNSNYKKALEFADAENRMIYEEEALQLDKIQKKILSISNKEAPYDVFICYKESDENGNRTVDSVLAQEIYDNLSKEGIKVFFSRISLEDKIGENYEPYIFNALNTAKVMLLVTSNNEYCNAVWVKNEWKRYLGLINEDSSRVLVPVLTNMSPYELPDELQKYQVQDMNKIGSMQDLIRGIKKIIGLDDKTFGSIDRDQLNELLLEREKRKSMPIKVISSIVLAAVAFFGLLITLEVPLFKMGNVGYQPYELGLEYPMVGIFILAYVAITINIFKGMSSLVSNLIYNILSIGGLIGIAYFSINSHFRPDQILLLYIPFVVLTIVSDIFTYKKKKPLLFITIIISCVLIATSVYFNKKEINICDPRNPNVSQLKVTNEYINVRTNTSFSADIIGQVYEDGIYTIYDIKEEKHRTWYKIHLYNDYRIEGYICGNSDDFEYVELLEMN